MNTEKTVIHMCYSENSLQRAVWGIDRDPIIGVIKGDTRILDYSSSSNTSDQ